MCKQYFYMRVSTQCRKENEELERKEREQSFERQVGIFQRAGYELNDENTFAERISGKTKADERKEFERLLSVIEPDSWVIFTETSRFSRSYILGMQMLDTLIFDKKVNVRFVSNGIELMANGKFNPYTWYTISQMLLADELQRRIISYNTSNGLQRKKELGVVLGRKLLHTPDKYDRVVELYEQGNTMEQVASMTGMSRATVSRILAKRRNENA